MWITGDGYGSGWGAVPNRQRYWRRSRALEMSSAASTSPSAGFQCSSDCFRLRLPEKLLCRSLTYLLRLLRHVRLQYGFASRLACFCDPCRSGSAVRERRPCDGRGRFSVCHRAKPTENGGKACNHLNRLTFRAQDCQATGITETACNLTNDCPSNPQPNPSAKQSG